jgi:hypothetical protein
MAGKRLPKRKKHTRSTTSKKAKSSSSTSTIKKGVELRALVRITGDETDEELDQIADELVRVLEI